MICRLIVRCYTLDSGINVAPGITILIILILFYINLGIAVIFKFFFLQNVSKINKRSPMFIPESRVIPQSDIHFVLVQLGRGPDSIRCACSYALALALPYRVPWLHTSNEGAPK
jgi:hypothetical protein